jgi:hypothetical protein
MALIKPTSRIYHGTNPVGATYKGTHKVWEPFSPLSIPWAVAHWAGDPAWAHPADGANVTQWDDATGKGRHAKVNAATPPVWRASLAALGGRPAVDFFTTWAVLFEDAWSAEIPQPWSVVLVAHLRTLTSGQFIDGKDAGHRAILGIDGSYVLSFDTQGGPKLVGPSVDTSPHLYACVANGTSSVMEIDGGTPYTGNPGSYPMIGLTLSSNYPWSGGTIPQEMGFVAIYPGDIRAHNQWPAFKKWVTEQYAIPMAGDPPSNGAVAFTGQNAQKYTRSASGLNLTSTSLTWCAWVKLTVDVDFYSWFMSSDDAGSNYVQFGVVSNGTQLTVSSNLGGAGTSFNFTLGKWTFCAASFDKTGTAPLLFHAEAPATTLQSDWIYTLPAGFVDTNTFYIGNGGYVNPWNGSIAAVKIWNAALTQAQLEVEMTKYAPVITSNLWGAWSFRNGPQTNDESGNGRTLTQGGTLTFDTAGPPCT